ncbi:hypothetical protein CNMCM7691_008401 [Aspergillus felis]|uniref:Uncharacterized protein n=1 Tax=Aspergillus felis TaxID=1287682 RepID=A0A8H6QUT3_9EURO|nr:hypothetical protein CNMCM7691_008401 [Aspergillus felis]
MYMFGGMFLMLLSVITLLAALTSATPRSQHFIGPETTSDANKDLIITGVYRDNQKFKDPMIIVHDIYGKVAWNWTVSDVRKNTPKELIECIDGRSATEARFAAKGTKVTAIIGNAALVIDYPGKEVLCGVCLRGQLGAAHTVELLPDNLFAIADTSQNSDAGVWIYDATEQCPRTEYQHLKGIRAIHGMIWDEHLKTLWVSGTTEAANGKGVTAYGIVQGYQYDSGKRTFNVSQNYKFPCASRLTTEWACTSEGAYWDGPHDLVPVPNERLLLVPLEKDIHAINLASGEVFDDGAELTRLYLKGFQPLGTRTGLFDDQLPRSDIKSISVRADGSALYTQAVWKETGQWFGVANQVNHLDQSGNACYFYKGRRVYRSRWFQEIPGWPTA